MLTSRLRAEQGIALVTTIVLTAVMLVMGTAILGVVVTQAQQTTKQSGGERAFALAEAALNSEAFLLGRTWPSAPAAGTCLSKTMNGSLATPADTSTPTNQLQSLLSQTYSGSGTATGSQWWVTVCDQGGVDAWNSNILNGFGYDTSYLSSGPRRLWVRAEAQVSGYKRSVVGLVQAGKAPVFPSNLAVVTGQMGADLTTTAGQAVTGNIVGPLLTNLIGGSGKIINGGVGLRCSVLDTATLGGCLNGIYKATSITTVAPLLQGNDFVDFRSSSTITDEQVALLRQQAKLTGTYYPNTSAAVGGVANGASCIPVGGAAGKIVFIEQVGNGTGHCVIAAGSASSTAAAVVVGSGGVRVCANAACNVNTGGTYTGVIYALHKKAPLQSGWADVRIEGGSKVVGGVFVNDNTSLAAANQHGSVNVIPPPLNMATAIGNLPLCQPPLGGLVCAPVVALAGGLIDPILNLLATLGVPASSLVTALLPQLTGSMPAITYNAATVQAITTMGDSSLVPGTFRQVASRF